MSKKGTKASKETKEMTYQIRDIVLGKIRGYPPWPGMVVDPDNVPSTVTSERPNSKKTTFYCVRFFPTGDYAWLVAKDISKLQTHEIESYINEPFKKSADLLQGYRIALNPQEWEQEKDALTHEAVEAEANAEIDQLEESEQGEEEEEPAKKKPTKKRKRESEPASAAVSTKGKKKAPKEKKEKDESAPAGNGKKKNASTTGTKGKKNGAKGKTMVESEDEGDHGESTVQDTNASSKKQAASASGAVSPPPAKKVKRDKDEEEETKDGEATKVRDWRHKLQKAFLGKSAPRDEDMPALDLLFTTVEEYEGMTVEYLTFSKIGKVMRHIAVLTDDKVPRDDEYHFRDRAKSLVDRWHQILNANKTASAAPTALSAAPVLSVAPVAVNGNDHEETKSEEKEEEKEESKGEDKAEKDVTDATAAIDLNGKQSEVASPAGDAPSTTGEDAPADADASTADVTMSEA